MTAMRDKADTYHQGMNVGFASRQADEVLALNILFARFSPNINIAGVTTSVRTVAMTKPPAMADDSSVHNCVDGAP